MPRDHRIRKADIQVCTVPTDSPEADGTFAWTSTTLVLVELYAEDKVGLGYTYGHQAIGGAARHLSTTCLIDQSPLDIPRLHQSMVHAIRNDGNRGMAAMAVSMLDVALWDLKARLLDCPVSHLLGKARNQVPVYGSGGFTSYSSEQLKRQLTGWADAGIGMVKIKVGSDAAVDPVRVKIAREAVGDEVGLFVDANGAYSVKQALQLSESFHEQKVSWFEEPVSSDHLAHLRLIRQRVPGGMEIAAGEYAYSRFDFLQLLTAGAVDVLQADATRCGGLTGFLAASSLAAGFGTEISAHCAPSLHLHLGCAIPNFRHLEYFHDHARIERLLLDGFAEPRNGQMKPDDSQPGLGLTLKRKDALRYAA